MADLRATAASLLEVADELENLRRQLRELGRELDHERLHGQQQSRQCNEFERELRRVQHILLQEDVTPDQLEQEGTAVVLRRVLAALDRAARVPAG